MRFIEICRLDSFDKRCYEQIRGGRSEVSPVESILTWLLFSPFERNHNSNKTSIVVILFQLGCKLFNTSSSIIPSVLSMDVHMDLPLCQNHFFRRSSLLSQISSTYSVELHYVLDLPKTIFVVITLPIN